MEEYSKQDILFLTVELKELYNEMISLNNKINNLKMELKEKEFKVAKEKQDIVDLKKFSFTNLVVKRRANYHGLLDKEDKEYIKAVDDYKRVENQMNYYKRELDGLALKYNEKQQLINDNEKDYLNENLEQTTIELIDASKATKLCQNAIDLLNEIIEKLESASASASFDIIFGGGLIVNSMKYSQIDEAKELYDQIQLILQELNLYLEDIKILNTAPSSFEKRYLVIDYFFDNIFTDSIIKNELTKNLDDLYKGLNELSQLNNSLLQHKEDRLSEYLGYFQ